MITFADCFEQRRSIGPAVSLSNGFRVEERRPAYRRRRKQIIKA